MKIRNKLAIWIVPFYVIEYVWFLIANQHYMYLPKTKQFVVKSIVINKFMIGKSQLLKLIDLKQCRKVVSVFGVYHRG